MWREILDYLARNKDSLSILVSIVVYNAKFHQNIRNVFYLAFQLYFCNLLWCGSRPSDKCKENDISIVELC